MEKKRKKLIIAIVGVIALVGVVLGVVCLVRKFTSQDELGARMSNTEFLISYSPWHKLNEDGTISEQLTWAFAEGGKGTITTNGGIDTYDSTWTLSGSTLTVNTAWLYTVPDKFSFTSDQAKGTFTVVDTAEDKVTTFIGAKAGE